MVKRNVKFVLSSLAALAVMLVGAAAFAQAAPEAAAGANKYDVLSMIGLACGLGIAIAAFGGALSQGLASYAALSGIARNPGASGKIFTPMILGLALIESLVIYALIISFLLYGKLNF